MSVNASKVATSCAALLLVLGVSCGPAGEESVRSLAAPASTTPGTEPTTAPAPSTTAILDEPESASTTTTTLPGDPFDFPFGVAGDEFDVAGVPFDEVLSVRARPGADQPAVASVPPLATGVVYEGRARLLDPGGIWLEVTAGGATGWVPASNLVHLGNQRDVTAEALAAIGSTPTAASMPDLGRIVTDALVPSDPTAPPPEIVLVALATSAAVVTYDTFPGEAFGSDDQIGTRYTIVGQQVPAGTLPGTGFRSQVLLELFSVEAIDLCTRGGSLDGFCV